MDKAHNLLNISYQRTISPDYQRFFERFYQIFTASEPEVLKLFASTDMQRQYQMLMESMTHLISFASEQAPSEEMKVMAVIHGQARLDIPAEFYDIWLNSLIETIQEFDPKFNSHVEKAWRKVLTPGIDYMKSFCKQ